MTDARDYWTLVEPIWHTLSVSSDAKTFVRQFDAAPALSRTLLAAHWCQSEVRNGGFHQFFWNPTGVLAPEAAAAYDALCMSKIACVLREAMSWFGATYPRERIIRMERLDACADENAEHDWTPFDRLDNEFFALIDKEHGGFERAANSFAAAHGG